MPVISYARPSQSRWPQVLVIAASLMLVLCLSGVGLLVFAIQQRVLDPPEFSVRIGHVQFGGPCPSLAFDCDTRLNYYAIWRGVDRPDGSVHFDELFFVYLPKKWR